MTRVQVCMVFRVGRAQIIGIATILAIFFIAEFALLDGFDLRRVEQALALRH